MHLKKFRLDNIQNGRLSAIIHFHMADAFSKLSTQSNSKWPPIGHYLLPHC